MSSKQAAAAGKKRPALSEAQDKGNVKVPQGEGGSACGPQLEPGAVAEWLLTATPAAFAGCFGAGANDKYMQLKDKLRLLTSAVDGSIVPCGTGDLRDCVEAKAAFRARERQDLRDDLCSRNVSGTLQIGPNKAELQAYSSVDNYDGVSHMRTDCGIFNCDEDGVGEETIEREDIKFDWNTAAHILKKSGIISFSCKDLGIAKQLVVPAAIDTKSPPSVLKAFVWGLMCIIHDEMARAEDSFDLGPGWCAADTGVFMEEDEKFSSEVFPERS